VRAPPVLEGLFSRRLLVVSGKGGVGKTTVAAALAKLAAEAGRAVLLVSTDGRGDAATLFGKRDAGYREVELAPRLHGLTADFDALLADFVHAVTPVRVLADRLLAVPAFRFFTRATPGLPDLLLLGKIREIFKRKRATTRAPKADLIVLDAPATGHALSLVALPRTLLGTVPAGPVRKLAEWLDALLGEPKDAVLVVVSEPEDFAAKETEELIAGAREKAGLTTALVVVNRMGRGERQDTETFPNTDAGIPVILIPEIEPEKFEEDSSKGVVRPRPGTRPASDESDGQRAGTVAAEASRFFEAFVTTFEEIAASPPREASRAAPAHRPARERRESFSSLFSRSNTLDLRPWLDREKLIVLTGPGGVGKTTLSAALGLAAPERMVTLLENDALRFFLRHDGFFGRALSEASRGGAILLRAADRVLGLGFLADLADFFRAFDGLYDGFKERSREAARLLAAGRFLVATTLDFSARASSGELADGLARRGAAPGLILNRVSLRLASAPKLPRSLAALPVLALAETDAPVDDLPSVLASALVA